MVLPHPWLLVVAVALALAGIVWLLRPPRRRLAVAYVALWKKALAAVGPQRSWQRPRAWMLLLAAGGLLLAGATGGLARLARRPAPAAVLVVVADTPHLMARDAGGTLQADALAQRFKQLMAALPPDTPVRLAVVGDDARPRIAQAPAADWFRVCSAAVRRSSPMPLRAHYERPGAISHGPNEPQADAPSIAAILESLTGLGNAADLADIERVYRQPADAAVYLLGEFSGVSRDDSAVQWIFRPAPPGRDVGIVAAGAQTVGEQTQVFVAVQRFAGPGGQVRVVVEDANKPGVALATASADLAGTDRAGTVATLPAAFDGPLRLRLAEGDDQPLNDVFYLAPSGGGKLTTVQLIGRPNPWIRKAVAASERLAELPPGQSAAQWLVLNEPVDRVVQSSGQGIVVIDPLLLPGGLLPAGELSNVRIAAHSAAEPWKAIPLDGVTVGRAKKVRLADGRWAAVASDAEGDPLIVYRAATRELAILFSVAPENTDWFADPAGSWPMFWDALAGLDNQAGGPAGGSRTWAWQPGTRPGVAAGRAPGGPAIAVNLPPDAFSPAAASVAAAAVNAGEIRLPPPADRESARLLWTIMASLAAGLLLAGWLWSAWAGAGRNDRGR